MTFKSKCPHVLLALKLSLLNIVYFWKNNTLRVIIPHIILLPNSRMGVDFHPLITSIEQRTARTTPLHSSKGLLKLIDVFFFFKR